MSAGNEGEGAWLRGRPARGLGHYLRDIVYGANDGVVTTIAVAAGVTGASLPAGIVVVLGLANLVADGISMAAGNYLSLKSELDQRGIPARIERPARHGLATFLAFCLAGAIPLGAYALPDAGPFGRLAVALALAALALALVGMWRARFARRTPFLSAFEMVAIGGGAAAAAYGVGWLARRALPV